jgi:hypothetical protein
MIIYCQSLTLTGSETRLVPGGQTRNERPAGLAGLVDFHDQARGEDCSPTREMNIEKAFSAFSLFPLPYIWIFMTYKRSVPDRD